MEDLLTWFVADGNGYPLIVGVLLLSGFGLPVPEDVPLLAAGVMAATGGLGVLEASVLFGLTVLVRDATMFGLGYRFGSDLVDKPWARRIVKPHLVGQVRERLQRNEKTVIFTARFIPGFRGFVFFVGTAKIRPIVFLAVDAFAAAISVPVWIVIGYLFADNFDRMLQVAGNLRGSMFAAVGLLVFVFVLSWWFKRRKSRREPA